MKTIQIEIPDGKEAKWVNNVLTLVDEQSVEFKFKVGDKAILTYDREFLQGTKIRKNVSKGTKVTVINSYNDCSLYMVELEDATAIVTPNMIAPTEPKDITERIKTFEDACEWCKENKKNYLVHHYIAVNESIGSHNFMTDLIAYLKLRIITCALNEGWEPTFEGNEKRFSPRFISEENEFKVYDIDWTSWMLRCDMSAKLVFKSEKLAIYAATQFKDIYMDFCYKGKE